MSFNVRKLFPLPRITVKIDDDSCTNSYSSNDCYSPPPLLPPPPPIKAEKHNPHGSISPLFVGMFCVLALAFSVIWFLALSRRRRSYLRNSPRRSLGRTDETHEEFIDEDRGPEIHHPIWLINYVGLEQSVIDSIDVVKFKKGEGLIEGTDCSVCLTEFEDDENLRLLPKCSHAFHLPCIDTWLRSHKNCPLCRAPIICEVNNAQVESNSNELSLHEETTPTQVENNESGDHNRPHELENEEIVEKNSERISVLRVQSDLGDHNAKMVEELQPTRRSISMDPSSASLIYSSFFNIPILENEGSSSNTQLVGVEKSSNVEKTEKGHKRASSSIYKRVMKSSSFGISSQNIPMFMKRSYSSSGKSSETSLSRSHDSMLPL